MLPELSDEAMPDDEIAFITAMLSQVRGGEIPNVEALDGFLTALVISPELVMPSEYVKVITSGKTDADDLVFETTRDANRFFGIIANHWNRINRVFRRGDVYMPLLLEDDQGVTKGNDWAKGFLCGTHMRHAQWLDIANSDQRGGPFIYIWSLAYEDHANPEIRSNKTPFADEQRESLIAGMIAGVKLLYDGFKQERETPRVPDDPLNTYMRSSPKVGRNDPCPCGSGKKYKKCCGAPTVH